MGILFSEQIKDQLIKELRKSTESVQIISAFCKESALDFFEHGIDKSISTKNLMVRFSLGDILSGATDFSLYEYCKKNRWNLYIKQNLHAKTYVFDNDRSIVGSSNLTQKGLIMGEGGNYEIAALLEVNQEDKEKITRLFRSAVLMNDEIYSAMSEELLSIEKEEVTSVGDWSTEIKRLIVNKRSTLFTFDFPNTSSPFELKENSLDFLEIQKGSSIETIKESFRNCPSYQWLIDTLVQNNGCLYFGSLSEKIHNALVNDPKPYRKEVKELQQYLLNWICELGMEEITIDQPTYSQRISLK